jgi:hypothetical protein
MLKTKTNVSQNKSKPRVVAASPTPKKSTNKNKDKLSPHSPRSNRMHTLEAKPSPQIAKKNRNNSDLESPLRSPLGPHNHKEKGY